MMSASTINLDDHIEPSHLPPVPDIARQFLSLHGSPENPDAILEQLVQQYPGFFAELLSILNSDHFNLTTKVDSLDEAIEHAGFNRVCMLMLCLVVYKTFRNIKIRGFEQDEFWADSLRRAVSARLIGELIGLDGGLCFTAGLLQDLGLMLLFLMSPNKGMLWAEFRKREPEARYSMERNIFNMNHDAAMEVFCQQWQLLDIMAEPVIRHHRCRQGVIETTEDQLCQVLYCADWMAAVFTAVDKGFVIDRCRKILSETFRMEGFRAEELLAAVPDAVEQTSRVMGIDVSEHIKFSQVLYEANIKLSEDNLNFQELTLRLEQALAERDRLAAELNRELGLAREIQRSLLPADTDEFPLAGINVPARDLSGDFFDYFRLPDGRIYFNLGDVSGKGVNAALLMAKTSSLFRCLGKEMDDPGALLSRINTELCETSIRGMFVAMLAGIYDPASGKVVMVNAGNPPALRFTPGGLAYEIEANAPPLGVLEDSHYPTVEFDLTGQSLYMFSDGITESYIGEGKKTLGLSGLYRVIASLDKQLSPRQRIESIVQQLKSKVTSLRDDITLLVLEQD